MTCKGCIINFRDMCIFRPNASLAELAPLVHMEKMKENLVTLGLDNWTFFGNYCMNDTFILYELFRQLCDLFGCLTPYFKHPMYWCLYESQAQVACYVFTEFVPLVFLPLYTDEFKNAVLLAYCGGRIFSSNCQAVIKVH